MKQALLLALGLSLASGCAGNINASGTDDFTVNSGVWLTLNNGGARTHELIATSVSGYCGKRRTAEEERSQAFDTYQQRLDEGVSLCEARDEYLDDLAAALNPLENPSASYLSIVLARDVDSSDLDSITAPVAGSYAQLGGGVDGTFEARVNHYSARTNQQLADAYDCEDLAEGEQEDAAAILGLLTQAQAEVDFPELVTLSAAEMEIEESGAETREITVSGDVLEGSTSVGSLSANFTATRCSLDLGEAL